MLESAWMLAQSWNSLLFAHWRVDPGALRARVPRCFELDLFDGHAWVAMVISHVTNITAPGLPALPFVSEFAELNFGTLVSVDGRPGAYFFSVDAGSTVAVVAGRSFFNLPYHSASISVTRTNDGVEYVGERLDGTATFRATGYPAAPAGRAAPGSLAFFLTERLSLYNVDAHGAPYRIDVRRGPWRLRAAAGSLAIDDLALASGVPLPRSMPLLHFVEREDMVASAPRRMSAR